MTEKPITDKFGAEIADGDTVEFVFGGDHFEAEVFDSAEVNGVDHLYLPITVLVPARSVALVEKGQPPKPASSNDTHTAGATTQESEPDPAPKTSTTTPKGKK